ncbi:PREDICTED: nuclear protein 2 [Miniopterus natalensis]|uniref:nuclear protein 2 n=1 Tax=Miniopterus natalensis TaxID=291302 RepID=UPI0007A6C82B|nr:PREDICTED: nuclear protein 2 [Miniopterus natalensis]
MDPALPTAKTQAQLLPPEASSEEELSDCLDYYYLRDFPACGAGHSKGRTRRERELRTNWPVPGGHERKIAEKLLNGWGREVCPSNRYFRLSKQPGRPAHDAIGVHETPSRRPALPVTFKATETSANGSALPVR